MYIGRQREALSAGTERLCREPPLSCWVGQSTRKKHHEKGGEQPRERGDRNNRERQRSERGETERQVRHSWKRGREARSNKKDRAEFSWKREYAPKCLKMPVRPFAVDTERIKVDLLEVFHEPLEFLIQILHTS